MEEKFESRALLVRKILESKREHDKVISDRHEQLDFLVDEKSHEFLSEVSLPIVLRNSWKKKSFNYLIVAGLGAILLYEIICQFSFSEWWQFIVVAFLAGLVLLYLLRFFESRVVIEISAEGLTFDQYVFTRWNDIGYLYYKTKYNSEGDFDGVYLVKKLKADLEHEVRVDNLPWSREQLGKVLYQCMVKFSSEG